MTDLARKAKEWLERTIELHENVKKLERQIKYLESRINHSVSSYGYTSGKADLITRQQAHEDALLDLSDKREKHEQQYNELVKQELITINVLSRLSNSIYTNILIDRYIEHIKWKDIIDSSRYHYSKSQIFRYYDLALDELGKLLTSEEPRAIIETEKELIEHRERLHKTETD